MTSNLPVPTLTVEHFHDRVALGIGESRPRLSWQLADAPSSYVQGSYEAAWTVTTPEGRVVEDSTVVVESAEQLFVPWPGAPLAPRSRAAVRVRVCDGTAGAWSPWSEPACVERGLTSADWVAQMVGPGYEEGPEDQRRAPLVRGEFHLPDVAILDARLHLTAHGLVQAEINGARVGSDELVPGWTPYLDRLRVYTYDVTDLLTPGANAIGAWLADGWFRGRFGFEGGTTDIYGSHVGVLAQLAVTLADGETVVVGSDASWRSAPGPLLRASLYDGEAIDLRLHDRDWSTPAFDTSAWVPVTVHAFDRDTLAAPDGPAVRCVEELSPVSITAVDDGWLVDYGQNHAGRPRLRVPASAPGTHVVVQHAEVLQEGRLCRRPLRRAAATDEIITTGDPGEWEPRFTVHGYRYAFVTGWPGDEPPTSDDIVSRVMHSDMRRTGWFETDREDLNRLHENVVWGLRSNFVDIPTDCPQRDERLAWTGDIQLFAPTAAFLYDVHGVLSDWLRTVSIEQDRFGGTVPVYVPWIPGGFWWKPDQDVAGWGDAAALVPHALYESFGDPAVLERQLESARTWVDRVAVKAGPGRIWDTDRQLGDWLDPTAPPDQPMLAVTDPNLVATAYFARSARAVSEMAGALGMAEVAMEYAQLAREVAAAYTARYVATDDPSHDTVCAHALSIAFDLVEDPDLRRRLGNRLDELVRGRGYRVATGFLGTPVVTEALERTGHRDSAYRMLLNHDAPSWLATVDLGATTIWERWDSLLPDGTVNPGDMTSFNHYALGSVAAWMHRTIGGLAPIDAGYRRLHVAPRPGEGVGRCSVRHLTPFGEAVVEWAKSDTVCDVRFVVPVGTTAIVDLPGVEPYVVGHGEHSAKFDL